MEKKKKLKYQYLFFDNLKILEFNKFNYLIMFNNIYIYIYVYMYIYNHCSLYKKKIQTMEIKHFKGPQEKHNMTY